jgi:hypothetical protein
MRYLQSKSVFEHYLKIYEEFEPSSSLKEDIKDIFIELTDNYLDVEVDNYGKILITKPNELASQLTDYNFDIDSYIIDSILRLIDYLKSNKLYLNDIIIQRLKISSVVGGMRRWVTDDLYVSNITEEGLFISDLSKTYDSSLLKSGDKYVSKLFTEQAHQIIIKYSNCL